MKCKHGTPALLPTAVRTVSPAHLAICNKRAQLRRLPCLTRAEAVFEPSRSAEHAAATVNDCLTLAAEGHVDALLEHVPDGVLDRCIALQKSARCVGSGERPLAFVMKRVIMDLVVLSLQKMDTWHTKLPQFRRCCQNQSQKRIYL